MSESVCDICGSPTKRGLRAGRGIIWLCDAHYDATRDGIRTIARGVGSFVKLKAREQLERYPVARGIVDFLSAAKRDN